MIRNCEKVSSKMPEHSTWFNRRHALCRNQPFPGTVRELRKIVGRRALAKAGSRLDCMHGAVMCSDEREGEAAIHFAASFSRISLY